MCPRGSRGAYRKEERIDLPDELQKRLVEAAATRFGTLEKLAKKLELPKSSIHYYRAGRLTLPVSVMERMLELANDDDLSGQVRDAARTKDRTWANSYAAGIHREMCRERLRLPTREELESDDELRRKAAAIVSYVMAEGSIWIKRNRFDAGIVNITFADHETDLYNHFRSLCNDVFKYDIGPPQKPGNGAKAIRGFICSRFVAEWLTQMGVPVGEKSSFDMTLPNWVMSSSDSRTWVSALQPWLDGEGGVISTSRRTLSGIIVGQSRHTDLDFESLPARLLTTQNMGLGRCAASSVSHYCTNALDYAESVWRSRVLDDVKEMSERLGTKPAMYISRFRLKENGLWSATWILRYGKSDSLRLAALGAIRGKRKRMAIAPENK